MNACGQHNMSPIGFQGMTVKSGQLVAPALQVLLGGENLGNGQGTFADKIIKIPSKRALHALRVILNDYLENGENQKFQDYYKNAEERYFYNLLKPLSDASDLKEDDFIDWGNDQKYVKAIGVGECAGVLVDLVATLFLEAEEKLENAKGALADKLWADSIYQSYSSMVNGAKAALLTHDVQTNTQAGIIKLYDEHFSENEALRVEPSFQNLAGLIKGNEPSEAFATRYVQQAEEFLKRINAYRTNQLKTDKND